MSKNHTSLPPRIQIDGRDIPGVDDVEFPHHPIPTQRLIDQARDLCASMLDEKDDMGRNEFMEILDTFPHGIQDISFMLYDKSTRIVGAERKLARLPHTIDDAETQNALKEDILDNLIDTVNYGIFGIMMILKEAGEGGSNG